MPEMVGSEFLAEVRKKYPQTIRMILTGQADLDTAIRAINEGEVYRYFTKPCNHKELATAIKQGLQHKQLVMQSRFLLQEYKKQALIIEELEKKIPETAPVEQEREENIFEDTVKIDLENLLKDFD
jgi:response regulator RpfG family c-di-GMP phosphodiesterase